ncbi:MAG: cobalamin biosynthesis protein CobD [Rhizobiales bacterium]|nr:cobalamin biosynthesis protein CobD [Hyphomicrobiales bacterium]
MFLTTSLLVCFTALVIERLIGYPRAIHDRLGHPVEYAGRLIAGLDDRLNRTTLAPHTRRINGMLSVLCLIAVAGAAAAALTIVFRTVPYGWIAEAIVASSLLAQSELRRFVRRVADGLDENLEAGRDAVRHIVGRDPAELDEAGVARAAIESLAENTSDGIVAPAFWLAIGGLPGLVIYKAINTADSMIGYKSEKYLHFGWAAARLDDLVNFIPARICGLFFAGAASLTSPSAGSDALHAMWRDAAKHLSPNAGWPEAAMAGALDISLGGPRSYGGTAVDLAKMGDGRHDLTANDIRRALRLYAQTITLLAILAFFCWLFV